MSSRIAFRMQGVQELFLEIQEYMQGSCALDDLMSYLDAVPWEFRSVAYESASMGLGFQPDWKTKGIQMEQWDRFYARSDKIHAFHVNIGLGWGLAKAGILPTFQQDFPYPLMRWMIFDGVGYYYGLFQGRKTLKNQLIPKGVGEEDMQGFDQGVGRRLWYICKGDLEKLVCWFEVFAACRHSDLWRGVGMACGYVGGTRLAEIEFLLTAAGEYKLQFCSGMALAAMSRTLVDNEAIDGGVICKTACNRTLDEIKDLRINIFNKFKDNQTLSSYQWIREIEKGLER